VLQVVDLKQLFSGSPTWARTRDLRINSGCFQAFYAFRCHQKANYINHLAERNRNQPKPAGPRRTPFRYQIRYHAGPKFCASSAHLARATCGPLRIRVAKASASEKAVPSAVVSTQVPMQSASIRCGNEGSAFADMSKGNCVCCQQRTCCVRLQGCSVSCWDKAPTESFWGRLKTASVHDDRFSTREQARQAVMDWIAFFNHHRLHSSLGYLSPMQFEQRWYAAKRKNVA
jgi:hypothetical protein